MFSRKKVKCADETSGASEGREESTHGFLEEVVFRLGFEGRTV